MLDIPGNILEHISVSHLIIKSDTTITNKDVLTNCCLISSILVVSIARREQVSQTGDTRIGLWNVTSWENVIDRLCIFYLEREYHQ
jgi:hypothetical protein